MKNAFAQIYMMKDDILGLLWQFVNRYAENELNA